MPLPKSNQTVLDQFLELYEPNPTIENAIRIISVLNAKYIAKIGIDSFTGNDIKEADELFFYFMRELWTPQMKRAIMKNWAGSWPLVFRIAISDFERFKGYLKDAGPNTIVISPKPIRTGLPDIAYIEITERDNHNKPEESVVLYRTDKIMEEELYAYLFDPNYGERDGIMMVTPDLWEGVNRLLKEAEDARNGDKKR